jgi:hypothetical protein
VPSGEPQSSRQPTKFRLFRFRVAAGEELAEACAGQRSTCASEAPLFSLAVAEAAFNPFDSSAHATEREELANYFQGLELVLRLAIWLKRLGPEAKKDYAATPNKRDFLERATALDWDRLNVDEMLFDWFLCFAPTKADFAAIRRLCGAYRGQESVLFGELYKTYVDPTWDIRAPLSRATNGKLEPSSKQEPEAQQSAAHDLERALPPVAEETRCVVCLDAEKAHAFFPCGHLACCEKCAARLKGLPCPICRRPAVDITRAYK